MKTERAKRAIAQKLQVTNDEMAVAHFAGSSLVLQRTWGSAALHPRLYAVAALRGLKTEQILPDNFKKGPRMIEHELLCSTRLDPLCIQFSLALLAWILNQTTKPRFWVGNLLKLGNTFGISLGARPYQADKVAAYCSIEVVGIQRPRLPPSSSLLFSASVGKVP